MSLAIPSHSTVIQTTTSGVGVDRGVVQEIGRAHV